MKRVLPSLALLALAGAGSPLAAEEGDLLRGSGLSFPHMQPDLGQELELVGQIDPALSQAPFSMEAGREYTWAIWGPVVYAVDDSSPGITVRELTFGMLEIREDPTPDSFFPAFPPNATVPSSFHDGSIVLLAEVTDLRIQDVFGLVTARANARFVTGAAWPALDGLVTWSLTAAVSEFGGPIPPGYGSNWSLELIPMAPVGVERTTWGAVKALYR